MKPSGTFELQATDAREARREIRARWPQFEVNFTGYDEDGQDVFMSCVRKQGVKAGVATAKRNRSKRPVKFIATDFK